MLKKEPPDREALSLAQLARVHDGTRHGDTTLNTVIDSVG
jgi:hypothetical protein